MFIGGINTENDKGFSVYKWFEDNNMEKVLEDVIIEEAVSKAQLLVTSLGARIGTTRRVIIVDREDYCCFEWNYSSGIVFPPKNN